MTDMAQRRVTAQQGAPMPALQLRQTHKMLPARGGILLGLTLVQRAHCQMLSGLLGM